MHIWCTRKVHTPNRHHLSCWLNHLASTFQLRVQATLKRKFTPTRPTQACSLWLERAISSNNWNNTTIKARVKTLLIIDRESERERERKKKQCQQWDTIRKPIAIMKYPQQTKQTVHINYCNKNPKNTDLSAPSEVSNLCASSTISSPDLLHLSFICVHMWNLKFRIAQKPCIGNKHPSQQTKNTDIISWLRKIKDH